MKQSKAKTGNLNQNLFFGHSRFWSYIAILTKGHVVTLHCNSKLILVHFINIIWRFAGPGHYAHVCDKAWCDTEVLHYTCACAERRGDWGLEDVHNLKEGGWRSWATCLALASMLQHRWMLQVHQQAPALCREPANKSLKFIKHLNSYVKPACFRTGMKQSVNNKTGTFLLFAPFLHFTIN